PGRLNRDVLRLGPPMPSCGTARSARALYALARERFRFGTFAPERRASDKPIAMACLRLVTFLPDRPLRSVPCLRSCIARLTLLCAFRPYLGISRTPSSFLAAYPVPRRAISMRSLVPALLL